MKSETIQATGKMKPCHRPSRKPGADGATAAGSCVAAQAERARAPAAIAAYRGRNARDTPPRGLRPLSPTRGPMNLENGHWPSSDGDGRYSSRPSACIEHERRGDEQNHRALAAVLRTVRGALAILQTPRAISATATASSMICSSSLRQEPRDARGFRRLQQLRAEIDGRDEADEVEREQPAGHSADDQPCAAARGSCAISR